MACAADGFKVARFAHGRLAPYGPYTRETKLRDCEADLSAAFGEGHRGDRKGCPDGSKRREAISEVMRGLSVCFADASARGPTFIVNSARPAASRFSRRSHRSEAPYPSRPGSRSGNGSLPRCEHADYRWPLGDLDRMRAIAKEFVDLKPDVIAHERPSSSW